MEPPPLPTAEAPAAADADAPATDEFPAEERERTRTSSLFGFVGENDDAQAPPAPPLKAGYLRKRPVRNKFGAIKERWITLHANAIMWSEKAGSPPRGSIVLQGCTVSTPTATTLVLNGAKPAASPGAPKVKAEVLSLIAESEAERDDWAQAIGRRQRLSMSISNFLGDSGEGEKDKKLAQMESLAELVEEEVRAPRRPSAPSPPSRRSSPSRAAARCDPPGRPTSPQMCGVAPPWGRALARSMRRALLSYPLLTLRSSHRSWSASVMSLCLPRRARSVARPRRRRCRPRC